VTGSNLSPYIVYIARMSRFREWMEGDAPLHDDADDMGESEPIEGRLGRDAIPTGESDRSTDRERVSRAITCSLWYCARDGTAVCKGERGREAGREGGREGGREAIIYKTRRSFKMIVMVQWWQIYKTNLDI